VLATARGPPSGWAWPSRAGGSACAVRSPA
jgi:hypothetical protein